jgi:glutamate-1-semialdehyde 2,1-aminomutase
MYLHDERGTVGIDMGIAATRNDIESEYRARHPVSAALHAEARQVIAGGIAHDGRYLEPFPVYYEHAARARKWDVDGHEIIDYVMGHGSLLLGHAHPVIMQAASRALADGTHFGGGHRHEVAWARAIQELVPSADRVRFTGSGTEATMMALRLAAIHTERPRFIRFVGHFHGWHDAAVGGDRPPLDVPGPGIAAGVRARVELLPADAAVVAEALRRDREIGAIILEPSGGSYGAAPLPDGFLHEVRELADRSGAVLIFDEVVTGFRWSPGGVQLLSGVTPDITTLAKIVAGGLPGGAVAGRSALMRHLEFDDAPGWNSGRKMYHPGTFNASPPVAAAGAACLGIVRDPAIQRTADDRARLLRTLLREACARRMAPCVVYGTSSIVQILPGIIAPEGVAALPTATLKGVGAPGLLPRLRQALLLEGVDFFGRAAFVSALHDEADIRATARAFDRAIERIQAEGMWTADSR